MVFLGRQDALRVWHDTNSKLLWNGKVHPDHETEFREGWVYFRVENFAEAARQYRISLKYYEKHKEMYEKIEQTARETNTFDAKYLKDIGKKKAASLVLLAENYAMMGIVLEGVHAFDEAIAMHEQHLALAEALGNRLHTTLAHIRLCTARLRAGHLEAMEHMVEALRARLWGDAGKVPRPSHVRTAADWHELRMQVLFLNGWFHFDAQNYASCVDDFTAYLRVAKLVGEPRRVALAYGYVGVARLAVDELADAVKAFKKMIKWCRRCEYWRGEYEARAKLVLIHRSLSEYDDAVAHLRLSLPLVVGMGDIEARNKVNLALAEVYLTQGAYDDAEDIAGMIVDVARAAGDTYGQMKAQTILAEVFLAFGKAREALHAATDVLHMAQAQKHARLEARGCLLMGLHYLHKSQAPRGVRYVRAFFNMSQDQEDLYAMCRGQVELGFGLLEMNELKEAMAMFQEAGPVCREHSYLDLLCRAKVGYALSLLETTEDFAKSFALFRDACHMAQKFRIKAVLTHALLMYGYACSRSLTRSDNELGLLLLVQALELAAHISHLPYQCHCYLLLGDNLLRARHWEQALHHFKHGIGLAEALGSVSMEAHGHRGAGAVYFELGEEESARFHYDTCYDLAQSIDHKRMLADMIIAKADFGTWEQSFYEYERAHKLFEAMGDKIGINRSTRRMGDASFRKERQHGEPVYAIPRPGAYQGGRHDFVSRVFDAAHDVADVDEDREEGDAGEDDADAGAREPSVLAELFGDLLTIFRRVGGDAEEGTYMPVAADEVAHQATGVDVDAIKRSHITVVGDEDNDLLARTLAKRQQHLDLAASLYKPTGGGGGGAGDGDGDGDAGVEGEVLAPNYGSVGVRMAAGVGKLRPGMDPHGLPALPAEGGGGAHTHHNLNAPLASLRGGPGTGAGTGGDAAPGVVRAETMSLASSEDIQSVASSRSRASYMGMPSRRRREGGTRLPMRPDANVPKPQTPTAGGTGGTGGTGGGEVGGGSGELPRTNSTYLGGYRREEIYGNEDAAGVDEALAQRYDRAAIYGEEPRADTARSTRSHDDHEGRDDVPAAMYSARQHYGVQSFATDEPHSEAPHDTAQYSGGDSQPYDTAQYSGRDSQPYDTAQYSGGDSQPYDTAQYSGGDSQQYGGESQYDDGRGMYAGSWEQQGHGQHATSSWQQ